MSIIFHITKREAWQSAQDKQSYYTPSIETDGFIHCSKHYQVCDVVNFLFKNQTGLILLAIDEKQVSPQIKY
jgi:uncharacterized protein (DUF952 family)